MSPPNWLPPVNYHHQYHISAVASQLELPRNNPALLQPMLLISTKLTITFYNCRNQESHQGLSIRKDFVVPCFKLTSPQFAKPTISILLNEMFVPNELNQFSWQQRHLNGDTEVSENADNLSANISNFACSIRRKMYNAGHNILPFNLSIIKRVTVPNNPLGIWNSWYYENMMIDRVIEEYYMSAIARPTTREELFYDANQDFDVATQSSVKSFGDKMVDMILGPVTEIRRLFTVTSFCLAVMSRNFLLH